MSSSLQISIGNDHSTSLLDDSDREDRSTNIARNRQSNALTTQSLPHQHQSSSTTSTYTSPNPQPTPLLSRLERRNRLVWWHLALLAVVFTYAITERYAITGTMTPLLPTSSIRALNTLTHPLFPANSSIASNATHRTRVVYIIIDGLRSDATITSPELASLLTSLQPHVAVRSSLSQVPSMSHPNWLTLATGVTTSLHGQVGNDGVVEVAWSSVWLETLTANAPNGVSGAYTWLRLFWSQLTPFTGDGTVTGFGIPDAVYTRGHSQQLTDVAYNDNLHRAIHSQSWRYGMPALFDYEMFMVYYSDVDAESHAFGAHSTQTQQAISDKADYIRSAMAAIDEVDRINAANGVHFSTTYVITADHGHVDVGGHGGDAEVIRSIPLIIYANHSYLSTVTTGNATGSQSSPLPSPPPSYAPSNVDIATTVAALSGVRVPRESEGMFVSDVMGALIGSGERAYLHYADLFVQKRALARELLSVMGQSTSSGLLDDSNDGAILPQPSAGQNYSTLIAALNDKTGELIELMERGKASYLSSQLAVSWVLATLFLLVVLLPLLVWMYNSSTFVSISALVPQRMAACFSYLSYLVHSVIARCQRIIGRTTTPPTHQWTDHSPTSLRLHRITSTIGLSLVVLWLLLMLFEYHTVYRYGYRATTDWQWQFTLFNSEYDAYVMSIIFCMLVSLIVCAILHVTAYFVLRSQAISGRLVQWLQLDSTTTDRVGDSLSAPRAAFSDDAVERSMSGGVEVATQRAVLAYYITMYVAFWTSMLSLVLLWAQAYHCFFLPFLWHLSSIATPAIWAARFQSFTIATMLSADCLYVFCVVWWQQRRLWSNIGTVAVVERKGDQVWDAKHQVLMSLAGLSEKDESR